MLTSTLYIYTTYVTCESSQVKYIDVDAVFLDMPSKSFSYGCFLALQWNIPEMGAFTLLVQDTE